MNETGARVGSVVGADATVVGAVDGCVATTGGEDVGRRATNTATAIAAITTTEPARNRCRIPTGKDVTRTRWSQPKPAVCDNRGEKKTAEPCDHSHCNSAVFAAFRFRSSYTNDDPIYFLMLNRPGSLPDIDQPERYDACRPAVLTASTSLFGRATPARKNRKFAPARPTAFFGLALIHMIQPPKGFTGIKQLRV